ncbi:DNA ligase D [Oleiagrimonas sp. C23AA]|uniref:DNA ligase D n=1 Tax=Oleiagrimonas sp. C23AA TaxID=2719047 RepID=UPI00141FA523|nr:DNA ligase D [Oleiagrimonas sp. C23AA]NII09743.1 DNA ligase D [Oleiagrimonas sp. C23AA]
MASPLDDYRAKRNLRHSREPGGGRKRRDGQPIFVVQLHHASSRHFDFRLEMGGTLRSWAVPKGPSRDPSDKRLAVQVEDHPLDYADFEGTIPAGSYGAGVVRCWDRGTVDYRDDDPAKALDKGHLHFTLHGDTLKGEWSLVRTGRGKQWLLIKARDRHVVEHDTASQRQAPDQPNQRTQGKRAMQSHHKQLSPQLATLADQAPRRGLWQAEVKYDGYRVLIEKDGKKVRIRSRNGQDWTQELSKVAAAVAELSTRYCVLDGELVMFDGDGVSQFGLLQQAFGSRDIDHSEVMCFDVLLHNSHDLRDEPCAKRRTRLESILDQARKPLRLSQQLDGPAEKLRQAACEHGLEGIILKDTKAPYQGGRNRHWLKLKCIQGDEFLAIGYTRGQGARAELGSLLLAERHGRNWRYVGRAGSGLSDTDIQRLLKLSTRKSAPDDIARLPDKSELRGASPVWFSQRVVVEVDYRARTGSGLLRQPSLKGIRRDKDADTLRHEPSDREGDNAMLTHPDKHLFDDPPLTKAQLAEYYRSVSDRLLAEAGGRPVSVLRCPDGIDGECFFQKHAGSGLPQAVHTTAIDDSNGHSDYLYVDDAQGLVGLVQLGGIELHAWGSHVDDVEHADRIVFDLDPAEDVDFGEVRRAARDLRKRLGELALKSFVRTSGGKGLHVVVPITPGPDWDTVKDFAHGVATAMAKAEPERFIATASKAKRQGRIFIDYLRNSRGATAIANYSVRARPGAPVATPLRWDELSRIDSGAHYTVHTISRRLHQLKRDPWQGIDKLRQSLPDLEA